MSTVWTLHAMKMRVIAIRVIGGLVLLSADRRSLVTRACTHNYTFAHMTFIAGD